MTYPIAPRDDGLDFETIMRQWHPANQPMRFLAGQLSRLQHACPSDVGLAAKLCAEQFEAELANLLHHFDGEAVRETDIEAAAKNLLEARAEAKIVQEISDPFVDRHQSAWLNWLQERREINDGLVEALKASKLTIFAECVEQGNYEGLIY